ncbi:2'-5' RNA ligase [Parafrankia soli]|uniref:2'-5' RNA ligase n=1 Tax=Parafrankia soli TaxID=2599596 RepID=A0A1S1R8N0_9ACTN|nr:2'-5' RNA ligase [Parafrankia soli]
MALGICLLFDPRADRALRDLWDRLEERGVPTLRSHTHRLHRPHLSYVVLLRWDLGSVQAAIEALPDRGPMEITFDALGAFRRGRISLIPAGQAGLVGRQQEAVRAVRATGAFIHQHYEIDRWLPHCALVPRARLAQLPVAAATVYDVLPLAARISQAALIDSTTGQIWPLASIP